MYRDLLFYYGVDLRVALSDDGIPPALLLCLIDGLPVGSMHVAERMAKETGAKRHDYLERGPEWWLLADLYDAVMLNTRATGQWKRGKTPEFDPYPRPGNKTKKKKTLRGLWETFGGAGKKG